MAWPRFLARHRLLYALLALGLVGGALLFSLSPRGGRTTYETAVVTRGEVADVIDVTGHAEPLERIELAFPSAGRLARVYVEEGQQVGAGAPIAVLEAHVENARLAEYAARIDREVALLHDLEAGTSPEDRALADASLEQQAHLYERAVANVTGAVERAFRTADDVLRDKVDEVYSGVRGGARFGTSFELGTTRYFIRADREMTERLTTGRTEASAAVAALDTLRAEKGREPRERAEEAQAALARIGEFLDDLAAVVHAYIPTDSDAQTVYAGYQAQVAAARSALLTAEEAVRTAHTEYVRAHTMLDVELQARDKADAPARPYALAAQEAALRAARAAQRTQEAILGEAVLRSPIRGTVTRVEYARGEVVTPGSVVVEVFAPGGYELVAYVPEADIASIELSDEALVTFDAFERTDVRRAQVVRIAMGETVREGVPTYKTTLVPKGEWPGQPTVRSGMTTDIRVLADRRDNVLFVPTRSIVREDARTFVRVLENGEAVERDVVIGLRGSEGTTEVVSGLREGEEVVLFVEDE